MTVIKLDREQIKQKSVVLRAGCRLLEHNKCCPIKVSRFDLPSIPNSGADYVKLHRKRRIVDTSESSPDIHDIIALEIDRIALDMISKYRNVNSILPSTLYEGCGWGDADGHRVVAAIQQSNAEFEAFIFPVSGVDGILCGYPAFRSSAIQNMVFGGMWRDGLMVLGDMVFIEPCQISFSMDFSVRHERAFCVMKRLIFNDII